MCSFRTSYRFLQLAIQRKNVIYIIDIDHLEYVLSLEGDVFLPSIPYIKTNHR